MSALKPYPHYEINVKDNSIYNFMIEEVLPVHRPMWILRTQEGPVGEPVWCPTASVLKKKFGEQTLNMANKAYASPQSFFLMQTMASNGAFIVRALDESAKYATAILEAVVASEDIVQYQVDDSGNRKLDLDPDSDTFGQFIPRIDQSKPILDENGQPTGEFEPLKEAGIKITYRVRQATNIELAAGLDKLKDTTATIDDKEVKIYPILAFSALYQGSYGNDLAFRFFNKASENDAANVAFYKTVFNSLTTVRREYNSSTSNVIFDIYGRGYNTFSADPDCADPETGVQFGMDSVITNAFDVESADGTDFPYTVYTYETNLNTIGKQIFDLESELSLGVADFGYADKAAMQTAVGADKVGYMINVLGGANINNVAYDHVKINGFDANDTFATGTTVVAVGQDTEEVSYTEVKLDPNVDIFLTGGWDGMSFQNQDGTELDETDRDDFVDHFVYRFLKLNVNPKIVDKFRYPITHLYDPGYSMTTKYAMIDFLDTRDDVDVELATQVLFPNTWATGAARTITLNDQAKDIADGLVLRERALLMRESVLKGTDCMRCSIYTQAGKPVAATYNKPVPFTFWSAMQHAQYGRTDQMSTQEPRGLPYSYNELFRTWNWTNYSELLKEKTWDAGLNYCQYADMTRIFYPALRTVYRAETSVLVDQWVVDSLVYTKHECRKAWARFSGRNDKQAVLEAEIKNYLEERLAYLYNGKYDFTVTVYKTEEEQKIGYIEHVKLKLVYPATMRVMNFDIEVNREGFNDAESEA